MYGVDFSPNSTRLVSASYDGYSNDATGVWHLATRRRVLRLHHGNDSPAHAAKYSPQGDRIATATRESIRVWDSSGGRLLVNIKVKATLDNNSGLLWFNDHLFVGSENKIKEFDASTGSPITEWSVPASDAYSCIILPKHNRFIAYSANDIVTFWDPSTHTQFGLIQHRQQIRAITLSPCQQFLAIYGKDEETSIKSLSDSTIMSYLPSAFEGPYVYIDSVALDLWRHDQLENAEALLTAVVIASQYPSHHVLASRALVQARLGKWDTAIADAEKALNIQPSVIAYIAKSLAHVGRGEKHKGYRTCDITLRCFHSSHATFLLLVKAIIVFMAEEHDDAISRVDDLITMVHLNSKFYAVQAYMYLLLGNSHWKSGDYEGAIQSFQCAVARVQHYRGEPLFIISLITGWKFDTLGITIKQRMCDALYSAGRTKKAGESLLQLVDTFGKEVYMNAAVVDWVSDFTRRCLSSPESDDDKALAKTPPADTPTLDVDPTPLLREWARATLPNRSWRDALATAAAFVAPRFFTFQAICERLETIDHITDATECFNEIASDLGQETDSERVQWISDFKLRCRGKLEDLGDLVMSARQFDQAILQYSAALSLHPTDSVTLFVKRSKARANKGLWQDALDDADEVITLDPSSPLGYERKYAALHGERRSHDAEDAFQRMLLKMSESSDPEIRERSRRYVKPAQTESVIRGVIQDAIRESPLVLINTSSGRLVDKPGQASSFESLPIFHELVSSTTTEIDRNRIEDEVRHYYRYAMFSHKWEGNEPLFEEVVRVVVYELEESLTHDKLQMFCKVVRGAGLHWAWSDTCCINKADSAVLQEALVSMFQWYQGSSMTVVRLCDVFSPSRRGDLVRSIWNTRAWTFQEYHASKVVLFYNSDWTLYRNLDVPNHKECPEIIAEMEEATGVESRALAAIQPGSENIRKKLYLASTRQATRIEDSAYSLFGIFSLRLPVIYGERDEALGRMLSQLLTISGDTSILAWTGRSGGFNSCFPAKISVYEESATSHISPVVSSATMDTITAALRSPPLNLASELVARFYDRLRELPIPLCTGKRMKLPCVVFKLGPLSVSRIGSDRVYRAQTDALGIVEVNSGEDLSRFQSLYLVHPWIDFLLDQQPVGNVVEATPEGKTYEESLTVQMSPSPGPSGTTLAVPELSTAWLFRFGLPFGGRTVTSDAASFRPPPKLAVMEKRMDAFRVLARLTQPFGALLLTRDSGNVAAYRRVAAGSLVKVQVREITPTVLNKLVESVRVLDVL